jgi:hypothetical protein
MKAWKAGARTFAAFDAAIIFLVIALGVSILICLLPGAGGAGIAQNKRSQLRAERKFREAEDAGRRIQSIQTHRGISRMV